VPELAIAANKTRAWACYDCGKCTATCPIARAGAHYSPRRHVLETNLGQKDELVANGSLFQCLTCSLCDSRCPAEVAYTDLVQKLREVAYKEGVEPECPHGGALQSVMRMMAKGGTQQDRLAWLDKGLETEPEQGDVFYWTGCTMYFDALFPDTKVNTLHSNRAAVRVMNQLGIKPVVSPEERCCGHDLLWNGDRKSFELLARFNVDLVKRSGAKLLVASCAECLSSWKRDYEPFYEGKPPKMLHISELISERLGELKLKPNGGHTVTFQDPCRLGRHLGIYDAPRQVLEAVPGAELKEMKHSKRSATCCAGGTWSHCDRFGKKIQIERLREARATGADVLVTACPKCQIHLDCAMKDPHLGDEISIELKDVAELVADALEQPATK
jgi:Fe-S oxidoreductase